jgi:hypothetical protein
VSYIGPTLHEKPPYLLWELVTLDFGMRRWIRGVSKTFHNHSFATFDFDIFRGRAMGWIIGISAADLSIIKRSVSTFNTISQALTPVSITGRKS